MHRHAYGAQPEVVDAFVVVAVELPVLPVVRNHLTLRVATEGLAARLADPNAEPPDSDGVPLLSAVSDNGPEMRAGDTAKFMAICSIAQHFGRPSTPTDQAWIESLFGHVKTEHPHLETLTQPADLARELERVRHHCNSVRLHQGIGYVTPDDEHDRRGDQIRQARRDGLQQADARRRAAGRNRPLP